MRHLQDTRENTFLGELAIPLPIFDTNSGAIDSAKAEAAAAGHQIEQKKIEAFLKISELQQTLLGLVNEYEALNGIILRESEKSFAEVRGAYELGKASYFELLDAQRTLVDTRRRRVETRAKLEDAKLDSYTLLLDHPVSFDGEPLP